MVALQPWTVQEVHDPVAAVRTADVAFQPIVSMSTLRTHGFEALCRLDGESYQNVHDLMDVAARMGMVRGVERVLLNKAISKFARFPGAGSTRLFCNIDNRIFDDPEIEPEQLSMHARRAGLEPANICIELSERQAPKSSETLRRIVNVLVRHNIRIAIDDFGRGLSGLETLMQVNPHYLKIDRAFIEGLSASPRRQAIVGKVVGLAHSLGLVVIAEGIETEADFRTARDLGCDLGQGYLIGRPSTRISDLTLDYSTVVAPSAGAGRIPAHVGDLIANIEPLRINDPLQKAIDRFKTRAATGLIPVIDEHDYVHGAIYEEDVRYFLFGDFGAALLANPGVDRTLQRVMRRCPISEATVPAAAMVDSYVVAKGSEGLVLTLDGRYAGVLGNHEILRLAAARDVAAARDQNPLTRLPGNSSIHAHIADTLTRCGEQVLVLFDFDHFKAFNDRFGFAAGDRALLLFADLLTKLRMTHDLFVGHVGGDDFFISIPAGLATARPIVADLCETFRTEAAKLYPEDQREAGGIWAKDRFGAHRFFPLLRASAALLPLPANRERMSTADLVSTLAAAKERAKNAPNGQYCQAIDTPQAGGAIAC